MTIKGQTFEAPRLQNSGKAKTPLHLKSSMIWDRDHKPMLLFECMDCGKQMWLAQQDAPEICYECFSVKTVELAFDPMQKVDDSSEDE